MPVEPPAPRDPSANEEPAEQPAPVGRRRRRIRRLIVAFIGFQLIVPLTYYVRADPYDERFAWRMFSAVRLHRCQPSARQIGGPGEGPVDLPRTIHQAWINTMSRNRADVIRAFLERQCKRDGAEEVELTNQCVTASRTPLQPQVYRRDCGSGAEELPDELIVEDR